MADNSISGMYRILPTYPVKPPQPTDKDRDNKQRKPDVPPVPDSGNEDSTERHDDDADNQPVIDEYV